MVAFTIVMPSLSKALQKAKGKLFPFGFIDLMRAKKRSKEVIFYLIGILPEYQNKGLTAIIFGEYYKTFKKNGVETCIRTPELEENHSIHNLWKEFRADHSQTTKNVPEGFVGLDSELGSESIYETLNQVQSPKTIYNVFSLRQSCFRRNDIFLGLIKTRLIAALFHLAIAFNQRIAAAQEKPASRTDDIPSELNV